MLPLTTTAFSRFVPALPHQCIRHDVNKHPLICSKTPLDDIMVASTSKEKHFSHLFLLFSLLREHRLIINSAKCLSGRSFLDFLGYYITQAGAIPLPSKMEAVQKLTQPTTVKALQEFLGMVNYKNGLIAQAAHLMQPLYEARIPKHVISWSDLMLKAFADTKAALAGSPCAWVFCSLDNIALDYAVGPIFKQLLWRPCSVSQATATSELSKVQHY